MVTALEFVGIARVIRNNERPTVGALIMDDPDFTLGIAHQYDWFGANKCAKIVPGFFHLALVADINPGNAEDSLQLKFENGRVRIDLPMDAGRLHEVCKRFTRLHLQLPKRLAGQGPRVSYLHQTRMRFKAASPNPQSGLARVSATSK